MKDNENNNSVSTENVGAIDDGSESFTIGPVDNKDGDDTPAKKEIKEEVKEEIKEESTEEVEEPGDGKPEEVKQPVDEDDESKLPKGVIKRLNKMRREKGDSEREVERLREEIESLKKAQQNQKAIGDKPDPTNFDTEAEYLDALTDWKVTKALADRDQKEEERRAEENKQREQREAEERQAQVKEKLNDAGKKYKDFKDVVFNDKVPITPQIIEISSHFDNTADVFYYLGKNIDEATDIARSGPAEQALALKDISDKLIKQEKKSTKAPPPIKPIASTGAGLKDIENMSYPEYRKHMEAREREARGR